MNTSDLITAIDAEISRLRQVRNLLAGSTGTGTSKRKPGVKNIMSAEGRAHIVAAQKKRWRRYRKSAGKR
jgi:hypothetical protein